MDDRPAVLYDGDCALCRGTAGWLRGRSGGDRVRWLPVQDQDGRALAARHGVATESLQTVILVDADGVHRRSEAVRRVLRRFGGGWPLVGRLLGLIPRRWRDRVYGLVARNRHRLT